MELDMTKLPLSARQKAILAACSKIQQGQKLFTEGRIELEHLCGEVFTKDSKKRSGGEDVTSKVKEMLAEKPRKRKYVKKPKKGSRIPPEVVEKVGKKILSLVKKDEWLTTNAITDQLGVSQHTVSCALTQLKKHGVLQSIEKPGKPGTWSENRVLNFWTVKNEKLLPEAVSVQ